jgi:glycerate 2-kinase
LSSNGTRSSNGSPEATTDGEAVNLFDVLPDSIDPGSRTRAVACPDKFRGTLRADEAAAAIAAGLRRGGFDEVIEAPLADGGEGTLDTLLAALGGSRRVARVTGPLGDPVDAEWGVLSSGVAVVEMARASGLALVARRNDPLRASTRGTGELIAVARREGFSQILVAVGGSATTDGGLAAVEALGWSLQGVEVMVACDVESRFLDAAEVFGPQKGATAAQVALLTRRLQRLADQYRQRTGVDVTTVEGAGAAGGLAGGLVAIGAQLVPGFEAVAEAIGLEAAFDGAALVVTGEGKVDASSLDGKVVGGVLAWAAELGVPHVGVIAGQVTDDARIALEPRADAGVLALTDRVWQAGEAYQRAALLVEEAAVEAARAVLPADAS